ncbi:unnamed protein product [Sphagnum jensenii]|uniref:STI1 domain-containing protein n=1 Tax=Sphagnum jensenii TaxID=128206 RepID=A0ABP0VYN6_9BRYO
MDAAKVAQLKLFVQQCEANPAILQDPALAFFRSYLEKLGAKVPAAAYGKTESTKAAPTVDDSDDDMPELEEQTGSKKATATKPSESDNISDDESDVELDTEGVVAPDNEPPQKVDDLTSEVTDENREKAQVAKGKAMEALAEGKLEEALQYFSEAISCNPTSAILFANRAGVYVKMKKPNAAIHDAQVALKINPDLAKGYKWRGEANALLGEWEESAKDLHLASRLDYDEEIAAVLKKVEPNVHKIEEHRRKYERLRKERDERRIAREKEAANEQVKKEQEKSAPPRAARPGGMPGFPGSMPAGMRGFPGGMPGGKGNFPGGTPAGMGSGSGGTPGAPGGIDMSKILSDPELMMAFQDPEVMAALQDVMKNPSNLAKHQGNPKVAPVISKMFTKFAGAGAP